jgi:hypothetical protein
MGLSSTTCPDFQARKFYTRLLMLECASVQLFLIGLFARAVLILDYNPSR